MNILFFDTETTGFVQHRLPDDDASQPHLVQIAAKLTDDGGAIINQFSLIVNPGVPIPPRAAEVHGITDNLAMAQGIPEASAFRLFCFLLDRADLVVAHNAAFDLAVMRCLAAREGTGLRPVETFCTMETATPIVNLPPTEKMVAAGIMKPKSPKLEECVRHFFNEALDGAHDALIDVDACARVFFHLRALSAVAA